MPAFLLPLMLGAGGAVAGALGNRAQTQRTSQDSSTSSASSGSASTRRFLAPEQSGAVGALSNFGSSLLTDPAVGLDPVRRSLRRNVTRQYDAVPGQIAQRMLAYGGDRSGKAGTAMRMAEMAKAGAYADVEDRVGGMALDRQMQGSQILQSLLAQNFGADSTSSESSSGRSSMTGTNMMPGNAAANGIGSGLSGLMAALALEKYLKG